MDAALRPAFCAALVGRVAEHQMEIVEHLLRIPAARILFGDDWGYQWGVILGAERWRRFIKPPPARVHADGRKSDSDDRVRNSSHDPR